MTVPAIIGHRGARARWPENTIEGFIAAWRAGVTWFEIDVGLTRDGVPILSHDPRPSPELTRGVNGQWLETPGPYFCDMSLADVANYDVGRIRPNSATARQFPNQTPADGARIPTLVDVLRQHPAARWTIEIKTFVDRPEVTAPPEVIAEAVACAIDEAAAAPRVVVQSFDWRGPRYLRARRPELEYAWLTSSATAEWCGGPEALPDAVAAEGGGTWSPHYSELTQMLLERAHGEGLRVVPWTVNTPADVTRLAAWGVDGLITDDPLMAHAVLHRAGPERLPGPTPN